MPIKYNIQKRIDHINKLNISNINKKHISDFINDQAAQGNSKARQAKYLSILGQIGQKIKIDFKKATKQDIRKLQSWINNSNMSNWTKHDYLLTIKVFYKFLYQKSKGYPDIVDDINPLKARGKKKLPRNLLTFEDIKKLSENTHNPRDRALIITLYETGARISELLGLKLSDIEFDKYGARITLPDATKTGARKIRVIWSESTINHWLQHHPKKEDPNSFLFCGLQSHNSGYELQYRHVNDLLKEATKKAGITKPVNPHHFRHSRATELAKKLTEAQLCEYMGWVIGSREARTYVHLSGRDTDRAILEMHGVIEEEKEKDKKKPIKCPRCNIINDPFARFCMGCSLGLDEKSMIEFDKQKEQATQMGFVDMEMIKDPKFREFYNSMLADLWEKYKQMKEEKTKA
jgi:site-specific recombinase XerD/phage FluMu protein Com